MKNYQDKDAMRIDLATLDYWKIKSNPRWDMVGHWILLDNKYPHTKCAYDGHVITTGTKIRWNRLSKEIMCLDCFKEMDSDIDIQDL